MATTFAFSERDARYRVADVRICLRHLLCVQSTTIVVNARGS